MGTKTRWQIHLERSTELKKKVIKLLAQGMSQSAISRRVGVSRQRIYQIIREVA